MPGRTGSGTAAGGDSRMLDLICIGLVLLFFALSAWLVRGCEALEKEED